MWGVLSVSEHYTFLFSLKAKEKNEYNKWQLHHPARHWMWFSQMHCVEVGLKTLYLHIMYNMIFLVGFPGSFVVICVYSFKMKPWKSSTIIRLNLALTDLLYLTGLPLLTCYCTTGEHSIFLGIHVQVHLILHPLQTVQQHPLPHLFQCLLLHDDGLHNEVLPRREEGLGSSGLHKHLVDVTGSC